VISVYNLDKNQNSEKLYIIFETSLISMQEQRRKQRESNEKVNWKVSETIPGSQGTELELDKEKKKKRRKIKQSR